VEKPNIHNPYHPATLVLNALIGPSGWKLLSQEFMRANMNWDFVPLSSLESATFETVQDEMAMFLGYPL
jgi:hypothetical protein